MSNMRQRMVSGVCLLALSACSTFSGENGTGLFSGGNVLNTSAIGAPGKYELKNSVVLRIDSYTDMRAQKNPRLLGEMTTRVFGLDGKELIVDRDLANVATASIKRQFQKAGYSVLEDGANQSATFALSGSVKSLTLNAKDRDDVTIAIETRVTDLATGKIIWSALVTEKNDRFAGVSGNSKGDLVDYLNAELRIASDKTVDAVNTLLLASYPALFSVTPGTKPIAGVTVYSAPLAAPVITTPAAAPAPQVSAPVVTTATGALLLSSSPSRAKIYVDEVYYGLTPLRLDLDPGVHSVTAKQSGYKTATEKVSVRKGEQTELELQLEQ